MTVSKIDDELVVTIRVSDMIALQQVLTEAYQLLHPDGVPIEQTIKAARALVDSAATRAAHMPKSALRYERVTWVQRGQ